MDDRVDTADRLAQGVLVGEVGDDRVRFAVDRAHVEQAQVVSVIREQTPHQGAEALGGAGEQNGAGSGHPRVSLHGRPRHRTYGRTAFIFLDTLRRLGAARQVFRDFP
ncbi:hypothetical protein SHKM778_68610 [Streptomyces sp. KM77-8]|uniref:Uncharacterized protein n=1 Tax=Streptomyces haneummycinicus TaxID=3074435 RepID=A0AAT9HT57_9ACTN